MDQYLVEIELIEWFRMARARSERATMLAHARAEGDADSAQRTNSTNLDPSSPRWHPLRRRSLTPGALVSGSSRT